MTYSIDFRLLGAPVDVGAAVTAGYERGRDMRIRGEQESAFRMLAEDPNSAEGRALLVGSGRLDLARQFRQWGREDRREERWRSAFGGGTPANAAPAPAAFPVATQPTAPAAPAGAPLGAIPPVPPATPAPATPAAPPAASTALPPLNPQTMREFYAEDPQGAQEFMTAWNQLNAAQRAEQTRRFAAAVPILSEIARMPLAERGPTVLGQSQYLIDNGWTAEQIQAFAADPNDQSIRMLLRRGVPIAEQREFFAPIEGSPGNVYRDPVTLRPTAANPAPPRTERSYDAQGNELIATVPGTPAIGPGAELFGTVQPSNMPGAGPQPGQVVNGYRFKGGNPNDRSNWEAAGEGGAGQAGPRTFP